MTQEIPDKYPEHAKLHALRCPGSPNDPFGGHNQVVGEFIEWLGGEGFTICRWQDRRRVELGECQDCAERVRKGFRRRALCPLCSGTGAAFEIIPEGFYPIHKPVQTWIAEHFGIDEKRLDEEKRQMLAELRAANADV